MPVGKDAYRTLTGAKAWCLFGRSFELPGREMSKHMFHPFISPVDLSKHTNILRAAKTVWVELVPGTHSL